MPTSTKTISQVLASANSMCRSAMAITERRGEKTNWEAFEARLRESLELQHKVMYPPEPGIEGAFIDVQRAAAIIAATRDSNGPPDNPPSKLWSALCNIWDHLDTLQQAIADGEYEEKERHQINQPSRAMFNFGGLIYAFDLLPNDVVEQIEPLGKHINELRKWVENYFDPAFHNN